MLSHENKLSKQMNALEAVTFKDKIICMNNKLSEPAVVHCAGMHVYLSIYLCLSLSVIYICHICVCLPAYVPVYLPTYLPN